MSVLFWSVEKQFSGASEIVMSVMYVSVDRMEMVLLLAG